MSALLGTYTLHSPADEAEREVSLYQGIGAAEVDLIVQNWMPVLQAQQQLAAIQFKQLANGTDGQWQSLLDQVGAPDGHWDWPNILGFIPGLSRDSYCVMGGGRIEAVMTINLTQRCALPAQRGQHLVYVEFLAIAPWNRPQIVSPRELGGLGQMMLAVATSRSVDEGWLGRVGLHSLPQSEPFYEQCEMLRHGPDPGHQDLCYFEFTPELASKFVQ